MSKIWIDCSDCGKEFYWSEKDQRLYSERGYEAPKRCFDCRKRRREEKDRERASQVSPAPSPAPQDYRAAWDEVARPRRRRRVRRQPGTAGGDSY